MFRDKLEKSNDFLEAIIETADRPVGDRTVRIVCGWVRPPFHSLRLDGAQFVVRLAAVDAA